MPEPLSSGSAGQPLSAQAFGNTCDDGRVTHTCGVSLNHDVRIANETS